MINQVINSSYRSLSKTERKIADYILLQWDKCLSYSSSELAKKIGVSQSGVVLFAKKMGFKGYPDLKLQLSKESREDAPIHTEILVGDGLPDIAAKVIAENTKAMADTAAALDYAVMAQVVQLLRKSQTVMVIGTAMSSVVAQDFVIKMIKIGKKSLHPESKQLQLMHLGTLTCNDALLVVSHTGNTEETVEIARKAVDMGVPLVTISSMGPNRIKLLDGLHLSVISYEAVIRASSISSGTAQMMLLDILFLGIIKEDFENCRIAMDRSRALTEWLKKQ